MIFHSSRSISIYFILEFSKNSILYSIQTLYVTSPSIVSRISNTKDGRPKRSCATPAAACRYEGRVGPMAGSFEAAHFLFVTGPFALSLLYFWASHRYMRASILAASLWQAAAATVLLGVLIMLCVGVRLRALS